jgi:hypothetical protein
MPKDTVTLKADGNVSLGDLRQVVDAMTELLSALTEESTSNPKAIDWIVEGLKAGSATIVSRGVYSTFLGSKAVEDIVQKYERVARAAHRGAISDFSQPVQGAVRRLAGLLDGRITRISMSGGDDPAEYAIDPEISGGNDHSSLERAGETVYRYARSAVTGKIVTLDDKQALYFTLREAHTGRYLRCYLDRKFKGDISAYFASSRWVIVEGTFSRYSDPPTMHKVTEIVPLENAAPGSWRDAVGCYPRSSDAENISAAEAVRRGRDAE